MFYRYFICLYLSCIHTYEVSYFEGHELISVNRQMSPFFFSFFFLMRPSFCGASTERRFEHSVQGRSLPAPNTPLASTAQKKILNWVIRGHLFCQKRCQHTTQFRGRVETVFTTFSAYFYIFIILVDITIWRPLYLYNHMHFQCYKPQYTFSCSLPENILSLTPKYIH